MFILIYIYINIYVAISAKLSRDLGIEISRFGFVFLSYTAFYHLFIYTYAIVLASYIKLQSMVRLHRL